MWEGLFIYLFIYLFIIIIIIIITIILMFFTSQKSFWAYLWIK